MNALAVQKINPKAAGYSEEGRRLLAPVCPVFKAYRLDRVPGLYGSFAKGPRDIHT